jgi:cell division protein FtsL
MRKNLREFSKKALFSLKTAFTKAIYARKNYIYLLIPVILFLFVNIIARTQEEPFQVTDYTRNNEEAEAETEQQQDFAAIFEPAREIPPWVRPARWFRSNSGGMPLEEMKSKAAALRGQYALVIDFTSSDDLPEYLRDYYNENYFIEIRTLFKEGKENRAQWIFRDENYGARLIAVLIETEQENTEAAPAGVVTSANTAVNTVDNIAVAAAVANADAVTNADAATDADDTAGETSANAVANAVANAAVIQNTGDSNETAEARDGIDKKEKPAKKLGSANGFIEIYDEKYHLITEYRYSEKGENSKIEYSYNNGIKVSSLALLWDDDKEDYIQAYTDHYRYNRSSFLRAVERVFLMEQQITTAENIIGDEGTEIYGLANNVMKISFPHNILAAAKNSSFTGERFNEYPEFFGHIFVPENSKLIYITDKNGKVLEQTLVNNDEEQTVIWKIVNTWSNDRIVKITKTEGETEYLAEYEYNKNGERVLERNIKDGVLERVVHSEGTKDIEELYMNDKLVLRAVWEDGRKISESRINKN